MTLSLLARSEIRTQLVGVLLSLAVVAALAEGRMEHWDTSGRTLNKVNKLVVTTNCFFNMQATLKTRSAATLPVRYHLAILPYTFGKIMFTPTSLKLNWRSYSCAEDENIPQGWSNRQVDSMYTSSKRQTLTFMTTNSTGYRCAIWKLFHRWRQRHGKSPAVNTYLPILLFQRINTSTIC